MTTSTDPTRPRPQVVPNLVPGTPRASARTTSSPVPLSYGGDEVGEPSSSSSPTPVPGCVPHTPNPIDFQHRPQPKEKYPMKHCLTCSAYLEHRLPVVRRLWLAETGFVLGALSVARLLAGVHARHQAGLPVMPGTGARR